jgi:precorrin-6Y C5,15-methyltransferase (decarboxylating)
MTEGGEAWLTIIGIGDNGAESLTPEARQILTRSQTIVLAGRIADGLNLAGKTLINWDDGFEAGMAKIRERAGTPVTVLATGDPMHFGIGASLRKYFPASDMRVLPSPSAFSLAASRLGWPLQNVDCISLHGRPVENLVRYLGPRNRILALTSDGAGVIEIAALLCRHAMGSSQLAVLEHIGGPREAIHRMSAEDAARGAATFADFNTLAIECVAPQSWFPTVPGLPDDAFRHDGQLTKSEIRAVTLSKLRPFPGGLLWDVGAGCGSVAIEWMRAVRDGRAIAIEEKPARVAMIGFNARALGVPSLQVVTGAAPSALAGLELPDAVFIGGGVTGDGVFDACWQALRTGGVLVANAVTLEGEAELTGLRSRYGGDLVRISVARAAPVGRFCGLKALMPVTIWSTIKEGN